MKHMPKPAFKHLINFILIVGVVFLARAGFCMPMAGEGLPASSKEAPVTKEEKAAPKQAQKGAKTKKDSKAAAPNYNYLPENEQDLNQLQQQARLYRSQGMAAQEKGDLATALIFYQKAIQIDPYYSVAYNDLGVIFENNGYVDRAEENYLQAITTNPNNLSPYSNLALLYEGKRDLKNAIIYWRKRAELGDPQDPWTRKARARYEDLALVLGEIPIDSREQEVIDFVRSVSAEKALMRKDTKALARDYFKKAQLNFKKGNNVLAAKNAVAAHQLDPTCDTYNEFIEKLQRRLLTK